jgi:hypothetical protein
MGGVPGNQPEHAAPQMMPDRAPAPLYAAFVAYIALVSPTPRDHIVPPPIVQPHYPSQRHDQSRAHSVAVNAWQWPNRAIPRDGTWPEHDTFTDNAGTDITAHTPDTRGVWIGDSFLIGDAVITNNDRLRQNSSNSSVYTINVNPPTPNYSVSCTIYAYSFLGNEFGTGIVARWQGNGNGYAAWYSPKSRQWALSVFSGGIGQGGGVYAQTINRNQNYTLSLIVSGSSVSLAVNAVTLISINDGTYPSAGRAGVYFGAETGSISTDTTGVHLDDYQTGGISSDQAPCIPIAMPQIRVDSRAQFSWVATGTPHDFGVVKPMAIPPALPQRADGPRWNAASFQITQLSRPDVGKTQPIVVNVLPDRATAPLRTAATAYTLVLTNRPDSGLTQPIVQAYCPDRADGPRKAAWMPFSTPTPGDMGIIIPQAIPGMFPDKSYRAPYLYAAQQVVHPAQIGPGLVQPIIFPVLPDRADGARRTAATAYDVLVPARTDPGHVQPIIQPIFLDYTWLNRPAGPATWLANYQVVVRSPMDHGVQNVVLNQYPDRAPGPQWAANSAYQITDKSPPDAGLTPIAGSLPALPTGPMIRYQGLQTTPSPNDAGSPGFLALVPHIARAALRPGWVAFSTPSPLAAPIIPQRRSLPDRAIGPQRAAQYPFSTPPPRDPGKRPVPTSLPDRAPGPRFVQGSFTVQKPRDPGSRPVRGFITERADGARRTASAAYQITNASLKEGGKRPIQAATPDRAPGPLARLALYQILVRAPIDFGVLKVAPIFVDPRASTEIYDTSEVNNPVPPTPQDPDARSATIVMGQGSEPRDATVIE